MENDELVRQYTTDSQIYNEHVEIFNVIDGVINANIVILRLIQQQPIKLMSLIIIILCRMRNSTWEKFI